MSQCMIFSVIRIGLTADSGQTLIPTQNPEYWGNAYLQDEYQKAFRDYDSWMDHNY